MREQKHIQKISIGEQRLEDASLPFSFLHIEESSEHIARDNASMTVEDGGVILICLRGSGQLIIDMEKYELRRGSFCIIFPYTTIQPVCRSEDFEGFVITVSSDFLDKLSQLPIANYYPVVQENPCIDITEEQLCDILHFCDFMDRRLESQTSCFRKEVSDNLLNALAFEVISLYVSNAPTGRKSQSRQERIFREFMLSLTKNVKEHRNVEFYANHACLTPRHFSTVIKQKSGKSPIQWINEKTVMQAKALLANSELSIQEISNELNFPNQSFFSKYIRKHTGLTPKMLRGKEKAI